MLTQVAVGVAVHVSRFLQSNAVVVHGEEGVLLVDAGVLASEMACLAHDLRELGRPVVAAFSTHPHWDHLLWHPELGSVPRWGTARCAATARERLSDAGAKARVTQMMPPDIAEEVPLDLLGEITGLPDGSAHVPWDGPRVRLVEHQGHAPGHAALLVEGPGVLVAGDMLSDVLVPMLDTGAVDPLEDYLAGLALLEGVADEVRVVVPGHGSVGGRGQARARTALDRAYVAAVRDGRDPDDPRTGPSVEPEWAWVADLHAGQVQRLAARGATATPSPAADE